MLKLTIEDIINKIKNEEHFHAVADDYSFTIKIDSYVPYACGAVHDGHQFRKELWENCLHTEYERWYEEDPETKNMVISHHQNIFLRYICFFIAETKSQDVIGITNSETCMQDMQKCDQISWLPI